jgi:hypothetical protein
MNRTKELCFCAVRATYYKKKRTAVVRYDLLLLEAVLEVRVSLGTHK